MIYMVRKNTIFIVSLVLVVWTWSDSKSSTSLEIYQI